MLRTPTPRRLHPVDAPARPLPGRRVVVVDDDDDIRLLVDIRLRAAGYTVDTYPTAEQGLASCLLRRPDALLLDVVLPGMSGLAALRIVRATPELADLPTLLMTARVSRRTSAEALAAGASAYLAKPFTLQDLTTSVATLVG